MYGDLGVDWQSGMCVIKRELNVKNSSSVGCSHNNSDTFSYMNNGIFSHKNSDTVSHKKSDNELLIVSRPLFLLWGTFGLTPTTYKVTHLLSLLWFFIALCLMFSSMYVTSMQFQVLPGVVILTDMAVRFVQWSEHAVLFGRFGFGKLGHIKVFLHALKYVDQRLQLRNNGRAKVIGTILTVSMLTALITLSVTVMNIYNGMSEGNRVLMSTTYVVYSLLCTIVTPVFPLFVLELLLRYRALNRQLTLTVLTDTRAAVRADECLVEILISEPQPFQEVRDTKCNDLRAAYAVLHRAAEALQEQYGPAVAFMVASAFFGVMYSSYEIIVLVVMKDVHKNTGTLSRSLLVSSLWLVYHGVKLAAVSMSCAAACDEERRTGLLLHRAATAAALSGAPLPEAGAAAFLREVRAGPALNFSAGGFFDIRRSLIISTFATVITHIVILTQFGIKY